MTMTLEGTVLGTTKSDSDTGNLNGNMLATLGMTFDPATHAVTSVESLEMTGGHVTASNMSMSLDWGFLIGKLEVTTASIGGTFDTPVPPGAVSSGQFNASDHEMLLNEGAFNAAGSGLLGGFMPANPYAIDLAVEPMNLSTDATGTITVSAPISLGGGAYGYDIAISMPVSLDQLVLDDPNGTMRAISSGTIEGKTRLVRSPDFGSIKPRAATGLEEADAGATSFTRGAGDQEIGWTMETIAMNGAAAVDATFVDPGNPANHHQFHLVNSNVVVRTERIDLRTSGEVQVSLDIRTWDASTGFETTDGLTVAVLLSQDGMSYQKTAWAEIRGATATALNKGQNGAFTTFRTLPGVIPAGTKSLRVEIAAITDSTNEHILWDNLSVAPIPRMRRGDCNGTGSVDLSDVLRSLFWLYEGTEAPGCQDACDVNDDGKVDIADPVFTLRFLFTGGGVPSSPGPFDCGPDPTPSRAPSCESVAACGA